MGLPSSSAAPFDPASLVQSREGTFTPPDPIVKYLEKHFKHCLSKQEREALFKEHPQPDTAVCVVPRVDKYITDFLGRRMPKDRDAELMRIQAAVLAIARPLTSSWQKLQETEADDGEEILVPASEVLGMIQRTLCLVGNASEYISQTRRTNILEAIDPSWSSYAAEEFPGAKDSLFGEAFQVNLTERVEKNTALAKAVSITKKQKKEGNHTFTPRSNPGDDRFFCRGPPARYGGRQGKNAIPYNQYHHTDRADTDQRRFQYTKGAQRSQSQFHQPRFPPQAKQLCRGQDFNRRGIKIAPLFTTESAGKFRYKDGYASSVHRGRPPSWGPPQPLLQELASGLQGSMGPRDNAGLQVGVPLATPTKNPPILPSGQDQSRDPNKRSERIGGQESDPAGLEPERRVFQPHVRGSQGRELLASSDQSEMPEYLPCPSPFQDGRDRSSEEPNPKGRLDGEARPQGCFPLCPNPSNTPEIPPLPMGGAGMGISDPAIWFKQCTIRVHEVTKASSSDLAQAGNEVGLVFGRYADSCSDQRDDKRMPSNSAGAAVVTWFHHQLEEECAQPNSEDRISRFSDRLTEDDYLIATAKDQVSQAEGQTPLPCITGLSTRDSPDSRPNDFSPVSNPPSASILPENRETEDPSTERAEVLRCQDHSNRGGQVRPALVGKRDGKTERTQPADPTVRHGVGIGRIKRRMGSQLSGSQYRRSMDSGRAETSHQLPGALGSVSSTEDLCKGLSLCGNTSPNRQCDSDCLCEQDGRSTFNTPLQSSCRDVEVVLQQDHICPRRASSREGQCESGLGVSACKGLQRLDDSKGHLPAVRGTAGAIYNRPIGISNECTTSNILQLETRPACSGCGCSVHPMAEAPALHVPSICIDKSMPGQGQGGESRYTDDSPSCLAEPGMVSNSTPDASELSSSPARDSGRTDRSKRRAPSNGHGRPSTLAAWPISGSRNATEDFLKELSRCSASLGGVQRSLHMLQLGDSGVAGVLNGISIPFQHL